MNLIEGHYYAVYNVWMLSDKGHIGIIFIVVVVVVVVVIVISSIGWVPDYDAVGPGSIPGQTNTQVFKMTLRVLKTTEEPSAAFALTSANG